MDSPSSLRMVSWEFVNFYAMGVVLDILLGEPLRRGSVNHTRRWSELEPDSVFAFRGGALELWRKVDDTHCTHALPRNNVRDETSLYSLDGRDPVVWPLHATAAERLNVTAPKS
jgi:hypothetical protein